MTVVNASASRCDANSQSTTTYLNGKTTNIAFSNLLSSLMRKTLAKAEKSAMGKRYRSVLTMLLSQNFRNLLMTEIQRLRARNNRFDSTIL